ncbi:MAG: type II toxin-antitoxin system YafQ family toxin [Pirellulales bacterium]
MRRTLLPTAAFIRAARKLTKRNAAIGERLQAAIELLAEDACHPTLKTHKLQGDLAGTWAASAGYDLRILFDFVPHDGAEAILLISVGTHDAVY